MPNFDIIKEQEISNTFRVKSILGMFDIKSEKIQERFTGIGNRLVMLGRLSFVGICVLRIRITCI